MCVFRDVIRTSWRYLESKRWPLSFCFSVIPGALKSEWFEPWSWIECRLISEAGNYQPGRVLEWVYFNRKQVQTEEEPANYWWMIAMCLTHLQQLRSHYYGRKQGIGVLLDSRFHNRTGGCMDGEASYSLVEEWQKLRSCWSFPDAWCGRGGTCKYGEGASSRQMKSQIE